jgi:sulfur-carrier protein
MATVVFTHHLRQHIECPSSDVAGETVAQVLGVVFAANPAARGYVLDDQDALRKHVAVFVDGKMVLDRKKLSDPVGPQSEVYVMQALSGG